MSATDREINITRTFAAPRDLVFDAWIRPEHVDRWMGPRGFTTTTASMDARPGGQWIYTMRHAQHGEFPNRVRYLEITPGERLVYDHDAGEGDEANTFRVTVTFKSTASGGTEVCMAHVMPSAEACAAAKKFGAVEGGQQTLERLGEALAEDSEADLVITRLVNAPRDLVWQVWTDPTHLAVWWGPRGFDVGVVSLDLRPGGLFHFSMTAPDGHPMAGTHWGRFLYREIVAPERLVWLHGFADAQGAPTHHPLATDLPLEMLNSVHFVEEGDKTRLTLRSRPLRATAEERRAFVDLRESMQQGYGSTFDQLDAFLGAR